MKRIDLKKSIICTIEERQENNNENVSDMKKQVKRVRKKMVGMEERQRRAII